MENFGSVLFAGTLFVEAPVVSAMKSLLSTVHCTYDMQRELKLHFLLCQPRQLENHRKPVKSGGVRPKPWFSHSRNRSKPVPKTTSKTTRKPPSKTSFDFPYCGTNRGRQRRWFSTGFGCGFTQTTPKTTRKPALTIELVKRDQ